MVKSGGDGVMASFGSASEAVNAAVALQEQVTRSTPALSVRVGIAAGDVAWEDDDCFGLPVVIAARLQATAEGGEILVSHIVRLLAGDRAGDRYEHIGAFDLKGLPDPVDAYTVGWIRPEARDEAGAAGVPPPLPLALTVAATHPLVGRDDAVTSIRQAWSDAQHGPGRIVLIGGEAGAGKTRLGAEVAAELHRASACVLYGGCDFDLAMPFQPWVHAIDQLLPALPHSTLTAEFIESITPLANLLPRADWLTPEARRMSLDASAERYRTYGAFGALLGESSARWPTLVVLDDLHWAGTQTLALLRHLARAGLPAGLLVVGTFRDTGDEITDPLASILADLRRVEGVTRLRLIGLDTTAVERFVADAVSQPLDDDLRHLAARLAERSGGNAFYLGELWRHLVDVGTVSLDGVQWTVREEAETSSVPDSVREVVSDRLAHLSPSARRVAQLAALSGQRVDLQVLEAAGEISPDDLDAAVDDLVAAGLLVQVTGSALVYRFAHVLVRDTVVASVAPHARARLHRALAEAIETVHGADRRPVLAELAGHFALAGGPLDKIAYYGRRAAAQAMRAAAYDEAVEHLKIVLEKTPPSLDRSAALVELARAQVRQAAFDESRDACLEAFRIATELGDANAVADAAIGFEISMHVPGYPGGPGVDMLRVALDMLDEDALAKRAEVMASLGRALVYSGRSQEGLETSDAAVALAREVGDPEILSVALQAVASSSDDPLRQLAAGTELAEIAERLGDPWAASYATANLMRAYMILGRVDDAIEVQQRHRTTSAVGHFATFEFMTHAYDAVLALAAADFVGAEQAAERAQAKGAADDAPYDEGVYGLQMYAIRRAQGRLAEVEPVMRMIADSGDVAPMWRPGLAALYADLGMLDEARTVFESLAPDDFAAVMRDAVWPASLTFLAETCLALGDRRARGPAHHRAHRPSRTQPHGRYDHLLRSRRPPPRRTGRAARTRRRGRRALPGRTGSRRAVPLAAVDE